MIKTAEKRKAGPKRRSIRGEYTRRDAAGNIEMIVINQYEPSKIAPSILVSKVGGICRINPHLVRVTMCETIGLPNGNFGLREAVSLIWENSEWDDAFTEFRAVHGDVRKGIFFDQERRKSQ